MEVIQLDKLEATEETLGVISTDRVTGEPSAPAEVGPSDKGSSAKAKRESSWSED